MHDTCIHSLTHGDTRYHYMAPCVIESISPDGLTLIAVIDYPPDPHCPCAHMNGERLRLDFTEVWAPTAHLRALRDS